MDGSPRERRRIFSAACCLIIWSLLPTAYCLLPTSPAQVPELPPVGGGNSNPSGAPPLPPVGGEKPRTPASPSGGGPARLGDPDLGPSGGPPPGSPPSGGPLPPPSGAVARDLEMVE